MARVVRTKKAPKDKVEGCRLIPLDSGKPHFPQVQDNVLPNTYFRIPEDDPDRLRALVTIMPDGCHVAWDSCGKCHRHVTQCGCKSGIYHPASIGWIRATNDINFPTERVQDYSRYFDPYKRYSGGSYDPDEVTGKLPMYTPPQPKKPRKKKDEISIEEIENLDLAKLGKEASKQAKRNVRSVRSKIKRGK